jgi:alkanesulfonate monooxygenase SsuD/methylene tetrahydromethanopterin reductase-like flavin-dependent oxidoreductase (luciferase family)
MCAARSSAPVIGVATALTHESLQPDELARFLEANGFESLLVGEHTHLPAAAHRYGDGVSEAYRKFYDPFVALTAAAAATTRLTVGTAVCLIPEHHPISLAKRVATLDRISGGRFLFGIGTGWNAVEIANHVVAKRAVEYGDGWIPLDGADHAERLEATLAALRAEADRAGRRFEDFDLTIGLGLMGPVTEKRFHEVVALGFRRVLFLAPAGAPPAQAWPLLEGYAKLKSQLV